MHVVEQKNDKVVIDAPAKINLFLEVLNKREDGFHNINSLFQAVSLYDRLKFELTQTPDIVISITNNKDLSTGPDNLISRAYHYMKESFGLTGGLKVGLEKNIPVAAGLGGGSADGAATILACNLLFNLGLTTEQMGSISAQLGSDLPFFFTRGQVKVTGRGEILEETDFPTDYWVVLINPGLHISTADSYRRLKRALTISKMPFNLAPCRRVQEFIDSLNLSGNDFEEAHLLSYPEIGEIKEGLLDAGASLVRMTGSGPTVFGVFYERPDIEKKTNFNKKQWRTFVVRPIAVTARDNNYFPGRLAWK